MTKEERDLLIKDLCARLPYWAFVNVTDLEDNRTNYNCLLSTDILKEVSSETSSLNYKPYLRPMSSMTREEKKEMTKGSLLAFKTASNDDIKGYCPETMAYSAFNVDYCLSHHFDYRGLIEKGLAIVVTEENNPY